MGVCEAQRLLRVDVSSSSLLLLSPPPPRWSPLLVTQITCRPGAIRRVCRRRLSSPLLLASDRPQVVLVQLVQRGQTPAGIGHGETAFQRLARRSPRCPPCLYHAILSTLAHRRARANTSRRAPAPSLPVSSGPALGLAGGFKLPSVSSPRRPWSAVVCYDRRPHGLRRGACMSPNGPEPPRQPRSHVGQTQAPAAPGPEGAPSSSPPDGSQGGRNG